jgi:hypothetical protein
MITQEMILLVIPLVLLEIFLKVLCFRDWLHREQFNGISKIGWLCIFLFINLLGPLAYLIYGRKTDGNY